MAKDRTTKDLIRCAVITGGHGYDVLNFHRFFRGLAGVDAYIQHMDDFASARANVRDSYDVVLFYTMLMEGPTDDGGPVGTRDGPGLHWSTWARRSKASSSCTIPSSPTRSGPPGARWSVSRIAASAIIPSRRCASRSPIPNIRSPGGRNAWEMADETYMMDEPGTVQPDSVDSGPSQEHERHRLARRYRRARVFCFQSGHDNLTWANPGFSETVLRGIQWAAQRI